MDTDVRAARIEAALRAGMDRACAAPMRWGRDDCALWCADILRDALGYDAAAAFRRRYRSRNGATRVTGQRGLSGALAQAARKHGWQRIDPRQAQPGDIGLALVPAIIHGKVEHRLACMICRAPGWFVGRNEDGFTGLPAAAVRRAWTVLPLEPGARASLPALRTRPAFVPQSAACHEPVSTAIGLTALLVDILGVSVAAAGAIGGAVVGLGVSLALNYAASALLARGAQPLSGAGTGINDLSVRYNERQALPSKRIIYGTAQVGGALFFEAAKAPYLYQGVLLCARQITAIKKLWIGTTEIPLASYDPGAIRVPLPVANGPDYPNRLQVSFRLGSPAQAMDPILDADFAGMHNTALIPGSTGTSSGTLSPIAAVFDGNANKTKAASASFTASSSTDATAIKDYGAANTNIVTRVRLTAPSDFSFADTDSSGAYRGVSIVVEGSNDNFATKTTVLTIPRTSYPVAAVIDVLLTNTVAYRYIRTIIRLPTTSISASHLYLAQAEFFAVGVATTTFAQQGIATAVLRYHYGGTDVSVATQNAFTKLWGQVQRPNPLFLVDGVAIYDPRDPSQDVDDETTWKFSNTAALVQADYMRQPYGGRIPSSRIDWDKVAEAADWDDGLIGCADGTMIKRHTIDGVINLDQRPSDVLSAMISANRGFILESAGRVWPSSSKPRASAMATIHDAILAGGIQYRAAKPKRDLINRLKVRFVADHRQYQVVDGPILSRTDLQTEDGEVLDATVDLPFTTDDRRAQRLQKAFLDTARLGRTASVSVDVELLGRAADDLIGNRVTISSDLFPQANGSYLVREWGFGDNFATIELSLEEYDPAIETDWNAPADEQSFTLSALDVS